MFRILHGRHKNIFRRFLVSYIFILVLPIIIGSYAYNKALELIKQDAINSGSFMVRQSRDLLDNYLKSIDLSVFVLEADQALQSIVNMPQPTFGSDKVFQLSKVVNNMKYNNISSTFDSKTYVFLRKTDVVIDSNYANYNIENYYNTYMQYDNISYKEWYKQFLIDTHNKDILPSHKIKAINSNLAGMSYNAITYIQSIPMGVITVLIDADRVSKLLHDIVASNNGFAFIMDDNKNLIAKSDDIDISKSINVNKISVDVLYQYQTINGKEVIIITQNSNYNNWNYVCVIQVKKLMGNAINIKQTVYAIVFIILLLGGLISFILSSSYAKPIYEIISSLGGFFPVERKYSDGYSYIKDNILKLINTNHDLSIAMENQQNVLKSTFIGQLLNGTINDLQEVNKLLDYFGLKLSGKLYAVIVLAINRHLDIAEIDTNAFLEKDIFRLVTDNVLIKHMNGNGCTHLLESEQMAVLFSLESSDENECKDTIRNFIEIVSGELIRNYDVRLKFGIGNFYRNILDANFSFSEARIALNYLIIGTSSEFLIWYSDIGKCTNRYYYPIDIEKMLINLARSGKKNELLRTLHLIYKENFTNRTIPYSMQLQLFYELKATLVKISDELNGIADIKEILDSNFHNMSVEECVQKFTQVFITLCDAVECTKKSHNQKLVDNILDYVSNNYHDPEISVFSLSSKFKISSSYFSQLFKEQTGEKFSDNLEKTRIKHACRLLDESDATIDEITKRVGYNNTYSFRRAFKRSMGQLPTEYRK